MNKKPIYIGIAIGVFLAIIAGILAFISFSQQTYLAPREHLFKLFGELGVVFVLYVYFGSLIGSLFTNKKYALWVLIGISTFVPFLIVVRPLLFILQGFPSLVIVFVSIPIVIAAIVYHRSVKDFPSTKFRIFLVLVVFITNILLGFGVIIFGSSIFAMPLAPFRLILISQSAQQVDIYGCKDELVQAENTKNLSIQCNIQIKNRLDMFVFNDYLFFQPETFQEQKQLSSFQEGHKGIRMFFDVREILSWNDPPRNVSAGDHVLKYVIGGDRLEKASTGEKGYYILKLLIRPNTVFEYKTQKLYQDSDFLGK